MGGSHPRILGPLGHVVFKHELAAGSQHPTAPTRTPREESATASAATPQEQTEQRKQSVESH